MTHVVTNHFRNEELFVQRPASLKALPMKESAIKSKDSTSSYPSPKPKSKEDASPKSTSRKEQKKRPPDSSHKRSSPPRKTERKTEKASDTEEEKKPLCPGCGAWLSEKHSTDNCQWILQQRKGYNVDWKTTAWKNSKAARKLKDEEGRDYLPRLKPLTEKKKSKHGTSNDNYLLTCDICNSILNYISNLPINLPIIPSIIRYQVRERDPTKGTAGRKTGILKTEVFLDSGALGGNFISETYAKYLTNKGFIIEKLDDSHNVCLANQDHRLSVQGLIKLKLNLTDEYGLKEEIEIKALVIPMKYDLIVGLEVIRDHDLTFRYPSIFSSKRNAGDNYCLPCGTKYPKGTGSWSIRTLRVTAPSTETEGEIEPKGEMKRSLATIDVKSSEYKSHLVGNAPTKVEDRTHLVDKMSTRVEDRTHLVGYAPTRVEDQSHLVGYAPTRAENRTHLVGYAPTRAENRTHLVGYAPTRAENRTHLVGYAPTRVEDSTHLVGYAPTRVED